MELPNVLDHKNKPLYVDRYMYNNLIGAKKNAKKYNGDLLIVIDGDEGSGKSVFARQIAKVLDPSFTEKQIAFSTKDATEMHYKYDSWKAIVLDESKPDLNRKRTMSSKNIQFTDFLSQSRILNKFFIIVLPSIYDLDKYVAEHRAKMLLHTYRYKGRQLGYFSFFGKTGIKKLFNFCSKYRNYNVKPNFKGRFLYQEVVDTERYDRMKRNAVDRFRLNVYKVDDSIKRTIVKNYLIERVKDINNKYDDEFKGKEVMKSVISSILGISEASFYTYAKEEPLDI